MMKKLSCLVTILATFAAGCDSAAREATPAQVAERETAFRQACAAESLALSANDDLATIQTSLLTIDPSDPTASISRAATEAALQYSTVFQQHAALQHGVFARLDSAVNRATTTADSARYIEAAGAFSIRRPDAGTLEANVASAYQAQFLGILRNPEHPCSLSLPAAE
jgi:hypothetical protein